LEGCMDDWYSDVRQQQSHTVRNSADGDGHINIISGLVSSFTK
jgi:hypothetical protein